MLGLVGRTISHYHILEQIGQGGMSSVFRAADLADGRQVAVKILSPYIAHEERFQARFEREINLLRRLQHPNIIPILDFGEAEGLAFIVMPLISSGTLGDRLMNGSLDPQEGGRIVSQLASALECAHENGVIHRDVKPSNVLVDEQGNALLSDFSFAHQADASQNLTGSALIGTPAYMSPEQCRGDPIDARSDQYSLAVVLFQITTGALPFEGDTPMAIALQHVNRPLPLPSKVNPNIPESIELVLIKGLAKDPALRYASIDELNQAFQKALILAADPRRRSAADAKTQSFDRNRTMAMYRKYQNVKPPVRRGWYQRSAILATLLLLLACTVSAGAIYVISPEIFTSAFAQAQGTPDVQATVDAIVAAFTPAPGTELAPGALETQVMAAVIQTIQASTPSATLGAGTGSPTPAPTGGTFVPVWTPTPTNTYPPGYTPPTATQPAPTDTQPAPTATQPGPTDTPEPPTAGPTNTPVPPTKTKEVNPNACNSTPSHPNYCTPTP
jgi:serine/threonine-protein kinase